MTCYLILKEFVRFIIKGIKGIHSLKIAIQFILMSRLTESKFFPLTLLVLERPKLYTISAFLSALRLTV